MNVPPSNEQEDEAIFRVLDSIGDNGHLISADGLFFLADSILDLIAKTETIPDDVQPESARWSVVYVALALMHASFAAVDDNPEEVES